MHTPAHQYNPEQFPHLTAWFRYRSSKTAGYTHPQNMWNGSHAFSNRIPATTEADYHPLTEAEEQRWQVLERRAKQENLSGKDSAEYEILQEIKLYNRYKIEYPQLSHEDLISFIRQSL